MIKVEVISNNNNIKKVILKGHAMYDDYGKDIVCASASSILTTTVNAIILINKESINYKQIKDCFELDIIKADSITNKLITNMVNLLKELETNYPKNIQVK